MKEVRNWDFTMSFDISSRHEHYAIGKLQEAVRQSLLMQTFQNSQQEFEFIKFNIVPLRFFFQAHLHSLYSYKNLTSVKVNNFTNVFFFKPRVALKYYQQTKKMTKPLNLRGEKLLALNHTTITLLAGSESSGAF